MLLTHSHMDERTKNKKKSTPAPPPSVLPGPNDILLGRSRACYKHPGNARFRNIIADNAQVYAEDKVSPKEKAGFIFTLIGQLHSSGSRFLRYKRENGGFWCEVDLRSVREKVGHALRDAHGCREEAKKRAREREETAASILLAREQSTSINRNQLVDLVPRNNPATGLDEEIQNSVVAGRQAPTSSSTASRPLTSVSGDLLQGSLGASSNTGRGLSVNIPSATGQVHPLTAAAAINPVAVVASQLFHQQSAIVQQLQLLQQRSAVQNHMHQMDRVYNNIRSNMEETASLLLEVGESARHRLSQHQHEWQLVSQAVSQQRLRQQRQQQQQQYLAVAAAAAAPTTTNSRAVLQPWETQEPSLSIKVSDKEAKGSLREKNNDEKKKRAHRPIPDVLSSRSNHEASREIIVIDDGDDDDDDNYDDAEAPLK